MTGPMLVWTAQFNQITSKSVKYICLQETETLPHTGLNIKEKN